MTTEEIEKAAEEYAESLKSIAFENLSGEETPYLLRGAFKEGLESANKYWQESVEMFNEQHIAKLEHQLNEINEHGLGDSDTALTKWTIERDLKIFKSALNHR